MPQERVNHVLLCPALLSSNLMEHLVLRASLLFPRLLAQSVRKLLFPTASHSQKKAVYCSYKRVQSIAETTEPAKRRKERIMKRGIALYSPP